MTEILVIVQELFAWLFLGAGDVEPAVSTITSTIIGDSLLVIPVAIMVVGLGVGILGRLIRSVKGV